MEPSPSGPRVDGGGNPPRSPSAPLDAPAAQVAPNAHLVRLASLIVVGMIVAAFARSQFIPATFGRDGPYRASAIDEIVAQDPLYLGNATCNECHKKQVAEYAKGKHHEINCETCHGPARGHLTTAKTRVALEVDKTEKLCLGCHDKVVGKPATFKQVNLEEHRKKKDFDKDTKCSDCHKPHNPEEG